MNFIDLDATLADAYSLEQARAVGRALTGSALPYVYNFGPAALPKWVAALDGHRAGLTRARIGIVGNSISRGHNPGPGGTVLHTMAWPVRLAFLLTAGGLPAESDSVWGADDRSTANFPTADPRVTFGTGVSVAGTMTAGGAPFLIAAGAAGRISFTPGSTFDRVEVRDAATTTSAPVTVWADDVLITTIASPGATGMRTTVVNLPAGTTKLGLGAGAGASSAVIRGWNTYTSTAQRVAVLALGRGGWKQTDWLANANYYSPFLSLANFACHLWILSLDVNDQEHHIDDYGSLAAALAAFEANRRALIAQLRTTGDVILVNEIPTNVANASEAVQRAFKEVNWKLALEFGLVLVDLHGEWGSYATAAAAGRMAGSLHPVDLGNWGISRSIARPILAV